MHETYTPEDERVSGQEPYGHSLLIPGGDEEEKEPEPHIWRGID
ncbi:hypothetical protein [Streptomyces sp. NPDC086182]|jgi:hypothetical protein